MTHYAQLNMPSANASPTNVALVASTFDSAKATSAFPDIANRLVVAPAQVQSNWFYDGTTFTATTPNLTDAKTQKQADLDAILDRISINSLVKNGALTTVTGTQVGNFLASGANNYRTLRASIAAAATVSAVNAIDLTSGWPANP